MADLLDNPLYEGANQLYVMPQALYSQLGENLMSGMRGELPEDALNLLSQQAAERGVSSGLAGSQAAQYAGLRNLRDVMLNRISQAEQTAVPLATAAQKTIAAQQLAGLQNWMNTRGGGANQALTNPSITSMPAASSRPSYRQPTASSGIARQYLSPTQSFDQSWLGNMGDFGTPYGGMVDITGDTSQWPTEETNWLEDYPDVGMVDTYEWSPDADYWSLGE